MSLQNKKKPCGHQLRAFLFGRVQGYYAGDCDGFGHGYEWRFWTAGFQGLEIEGNESLGEKSHIPALFHRYGHAILQRPVRSGCYCD